MKKEREDGLFKVKILNRDAGYGNCREGSFTMLKQKLNSLVSDIKTDLELGIPD